MREIIVKSATRNEIIEHYAAIVKGESLWPTRESSSSKVGDIWVRPHATIKKQIDDAISMGNPLVPIRMFKIIPSRNENFPDENDFHEISELWIISDYADLKLDLIMKEIDDDSLRNQKLDRLRMLLDAEKNSKELYEKIVAAMDELKGTTFKFYGKSNYKINRQ